MQEERNQFIDRKQKVHPKDINKENVARVHPQSSEVAHKGVPHSMIGDGRDKTALPPVERKRSGHIRLRACKGHAHGPGQGLTEPAQKYRPG